MSVTKPSELHTKAKTPNDYPLKSLPVSTPITEPVTSHVPFHADPSKITSPMYVIYQSDVGKLSDHNNKRESHRRLRLASSNSLQRSFIAIAIVSHVHTIPS